MLTLFAVNRCTDKPLELTADLRSFGVGRVAEHIVLTGDDLSAVNTEAQPDRVKPVQGEGAVLDGGIMTAMLPRQSWNVLRLQLQ